MTCATPDQDPSAPPNPAPQPSGHLWLPRWLAQLAVIAATLGRRIGGRDEDRAANPAIPAAGEAALAWYLLARAMRWMTALAARIVAERRAAMAAAVAMERQTGQDAPAPPPAAPTPRKPVPGGRLGRDAGIGDRPAVEVIGQICADLTAAASLLQSPALARQIAEIAAAARALLGGPAAGWKPMRMISQGCHAAAAAAKAAVADMMAAVMPVPAPDTG